MAHPQIFEFWIALKEYFYSNSNIEHRRNEALKIFRSFCHLFTHSEISIFNFILTFSLFSMMITFLPCLDYAIQPAGNEQRIISTSSKNNASSTHQDRYVCGLSSLTNIFNEQTFFTHSNSPFTQLSFTGVHFFQKFSA